jgi:pantoate--beta-alanine ligase
VIKAYSLSELQEVLQVKVSKNQIIGLVPTMGALHEGHASLVLKAKEECDFVIVTIFVNPTQFNNPDDLLKYPKSEEADALLLEKLGCDLVFFPNESTIYSSDYHFPGIDLGFLDTTMEGKYRPGHFQGVCQVVYRLFELTKPNKAFFGLKDFQQVSVIQYMTHYFNLPIEIIPCETSRNSNGLALSSRNLRLNEIQKQEALILFKTLNEAKQNAFHSTPKEVKEKAEKSILSSQLKLEYIEIVNPKTLENLNQTWFPGARMCIVAYAGDVRLIDNLEIRE